MNTAFGHKIFIQDPLVEDKEAVEFTQDAVAISFGIPRESRYMELLMNHTEEEKKDERSHKRYFMKNFKELQMSYALEWIDVYVRKSPFNSAEVLRSYYFGFGERGSVYPTTSSTTDPNFNIFGIKDWNPSDEEFLLSNPDGIFVESVRCVNLLVNKALIAMHQMNSFLRTNGFGRLFKYADQSNLLLYYSLKEVGSDMYSFSFSSTFNIIIIGKI